MLFIAPAIKEYCLDSTTNWNLASCLPVNGQIEILLVRADRNFAEQIEIDCKAAIEITAATAVEFQIGSRRLRNSNSAAAWRAGSNFDSLSG